MSENELIKNPASGLGRYYSYLNTAAAILKSYPGGQPFTLFLKAFFSGHKKFGSRDRKQIGQLCYGYFRLGKSFSEETIEQRLLLGVKWSGHPLDSGWQQVLEKEGLPEQAPEGVFPWKSMLSPQIDGDGYEASLLIQPDLFLRIRPGSTPAVIAKLEQAGIPFLQDGASIRLDNSVRIGDILAINSEVVVQDLSSQKTAILLEKVRELETKKRIQVYDACAASGGKSILVADTFPEIDLVVSDIRSAILVNLKNRFKAAGIKNFQSIVCDLTRNVPPLSGKTFDLVIADVPCTGSGTWARTPEQLCYFNPDTIQTYANLQKNITQHVMPIIKPGGYLLYITCSVFQAENEGQMAGLESQGFKLLDQQWFKGYDQKSDTLFAALLKRD